MDFDLGFFEGTTIPAEPILTELTEIQAFDGNFSRFVITETQGAGIVQVGLGSRGLTMGGTFNLTSYVYVQTGVQGISLVEVFIGPELIGNVTIGGKSKTLYIK